jgi:hypothetical protein
VYDLDGAVGGGAGVGPSDLSLWLFDSFSIPYEARSDYDYNVLCVQDIGPADLSKWLAVSFSNSSSNGPAFIACP